MKTKIKCIDPRMFVFLSVSDAAWANADKLLYLHYSSLAGYTIAVVDKRIMRGVWADMSLLR